MLEIVAKLLEQALDKLIGKTIDLSAKSLEKRRSLLDSLLAVHEALVEIEGESYRTYDTFSRWALQDGSVTKVVLRSSGQLRYYFRV